MSVFPARRRFLKTALAILTGAAAPAVQAPVTWAVPMPNFQSVPDVGATPNHTEELLLRLPDLDGIDLRTASDEELPAERGAVLGLYRYEGDRSRTIHRLVLPWMDVRAGLYVRSAVPYRIRADIGRDDGKLRTSIALGRRASVVVYREAPRWIVRPPWQVVVVVT